ncbi:type IX secretion system membrane protein, PorP/SprF family [Pedobacter sp. ok626]|uniref:PorP/SprF family type IX secretion system membrane protein n=1 Tax=Pedobacter sp. ok626 TaxID=1761882 RepID=UPI0008892C07|nr:type IX secretion system membrane protein PorP/SprF [Pedobacter sp. ok626]SDK16509.1 type IX secretion system membrane protein, PorP/SprF family [Pedobacter sp. ok626]
MMKSVKCMSVLVFLLCSFAGRLSAQQNIQFTQYIFNSLSVNPAYAGYKEEWFAQLALRSQWVGVEGAPQTGAMSIDGILDPRDRKMGLGFQITSDKIGPQFTTSLTANYAYRLQLDADDTKRLSFGIGLGVVQYNLNGDMIRTSEGGDQAIAIGDENSMKPDVRFGVFYNSDFWYMGLSILDAFSGSGVTSITSSPSFNISRSRHAYFITGGLVNVSPDMRIRPSLMVKEDFRGPTSVDLNVMTIFNDKLWIGASYRTGFGLWKKDINKLDLGKQNSISGIVQVFVSERFRIGYSYDHVTSQLNSNQNGSHEITMGLTFGRVPRSFICPRVF